VAVTFKVEIAYTTLPTVNMDAQTWTDVTACVLTTGDGSPIDIRSGRQDEYSRVQASTCSLVLDNTDGRFTPGYASSPYYPNVEPGRYLRVTLDNSGHISRRFTGIIDAYDIGEWAQAPAHKVVTVTATDRLARLNRGPLRSWPEEQTLTSAPSGYWPLGEPEGSTSGASVTVLPQSSLAVTAVSGGKIRFGAGTGPGTDGLTAPSFEPVLDTFGQVVGYSYLRATLAAALNYGPTSGTPLTISCWFSVRAVPSNSQGTLVGLLTAGSFGVQITLTAAGSIYAYITDVPVVNFADVNGPDVSIDRTYHVVLVAVPGQSLKLYVDGVLYTGGTCPTFTKTANTVAVGEFFDGVISHAAVYTTAILQAAAQDQNTAGTTAFSGATAATVVSKVASYAGVPTNDWFSTFDSGMSTLGVLPLVGQTPLSVINLAEAAEDGLVFFRGDGRMMFHSRSRRLNPPSPAFTFAVASDHMAGGPAFRMDDQARLVNDATVARTGGGSFRVVDSASITARGQYINPAEEYPYSDDNQAFDRATAIVAGYAAPKVRMRQLYAEVLTFDSGQINNLIDLGINSYIATSGLSSDAPPIGNQWIEGLAESISVDGINITFNTSPQVWAGSFWVLGTSQLGVDTKLAY